MERLYDIAEVGGTDYTFVATRGMDLYANLMHVDFRQPPFCPQTLVCPHLVR